MNADKIHILYLDDEINNLISFKATFRFKYKVHVALNTQEAVKALENNDIQILLTDQQMPGISGLEFVDMVKKKYPHVACALITGYTPEKQISDAIEAAKIFAYLPKPWDETKLENVIEKATLTCTTQGVNSLTNNEPIKNTTLLTNQHIIHSATIAVV